MVGFVILLFLLSVGIITLYGWVKLRGLQVSALLHGRRGLGTYTPGRFALLLKALDREGFFEPVPGQLMVTVIDNDFLSGVISDMATTDAFFTEVVRRELNVRNNPTPHPYRYLLCSDYAVIGFNQGRTTNPR